MSDPNKVYLEGNDSLLEVQRRLKQEDGWRIKLDVYRPLHQTLEIDIPESQAKHFLDFFSGRNTVFYIEPNVMAMKVVQQYVFISFIQLGRDIMIASTKQGFEEFQKKIAALAQQPYEEPETDETLEN